jgi:hypothetical protein
MEQKQFDLFLAAFFSDKEKLDGLLNTSNDLDLTCNISYAGFETEKTDFNFSVLDILQMNLDCWASLKEKEELNSPQPINPKIFYKNTLECFENMLKLFPDMPYHGINYEHYIFLILCCDDDEHWFSEAEMKAYKAEGYKTIDLELITLI